MQFESIAEFFAMGGHALYVWLAYGATIAVVLGSHVAVKRSLASELSKLRWANQQAEGGQPNE
jgi:heme exporter protein D